MKGLKITTLGLAFGVLATASFAQAGDRMAICPWHFNDGTESSRAMVIDTISKIMNRHGYSVMEQRPDDVRNSPPPIRMHRDDPDMDDLAHFGQSVNALHVVFGSTSWHTRSVWVGTGPKTISTATVDVFIYDVRAGKIEYQSRGVQGRSDERESLLKDVGDVLVTPLITVVSGGPATPREQRAAQIALARAIRPWFHRDDRHSR